MIKNFILKTFKVRKIYYERKLALFLKKSDLRIWKAFAAQSAHRENPAYGVEGKT